MVMNPEVVVRPWGRVENGEPVKAVLQAGRSVGPRLIGFATEIAVETVWPRLAVSEGSEPDVDANPVLRRQCFRGTNDQAIGVFGRGNLQHVMVRIGRIRNHLE